MTWGAERAAGAGGLSLGTVVLGAVLGMQQRGRRDRAVLRAGRDRLDLAAEAAALGVWAWDIEHDRLVRDEGMPRVYGLAPVPASAPTGAIAGTHADHGAVVGPAAEPFAETSATWAQAPHPEDRARTEGGLRAALRAGREFAFGARAVLPPRAAAVAPWSARLGDRGFGRPSPSPSPR